MKHKSPFSAIMLLFVIGLSFPLSGQDKNTGINEIRQGIELYKMSDFRGARLRFGAVLSNPSFSPTHGDALFWTAKTDIAAGRYDSASKNIEHFLKDYPSNPYFPEALYEKGRLLYLQGEFESAITVLHGFISNYPESEYTANAFFWIGESLYSLGDLKSAERMFSTVAAKYPTSFRVEAAKYRVALIELKYREEELLKLLKWSHEEYLTTLEDSKRRETAYAEAVVVYQQKLAALDAKDFKGEVLRLTEKVNALETELKLAESRLEKQNTSFDNSDRITAVPASASELENKMKAIAIKEEALRLKEFYLERLIKEFEGKIK